MLKCGWGCGITFVPNKAEYGEFTLTGDFKDDPVRLDDRSSDGWRALAETLRAFVLRDSRKPLDTGVTGSTGLLTFPNRQKTLRPGLYLLLGESFVSGGYSYTVEPSLICLPCADETSNTWDYDAALAPKHDREPLPPAPSDDTVERKVLKVWDDDGAEDSRPQEITVELLRNGKVYDTVKLSEKNNWRYTWLDLDADARWSVTEKTVSGYTVSITREGITFVVTNTKKPDRTDTPDTPVKPSNPSKPSSPAKPTLPQTGAVWWHVEALALSGLVFLILGALDRKTEA